MLVDNPSRLSTTLQKPTKRAVQLRAFLLEHADQPTVIAQAVEQFGITRQAVHKHVSALIAAGELTAEGNTRKRVYRAQAKTFSKSYRIAPNLAEDKVWRDDVEPFLSGLPKQALDIWNYAFTEMFNNAIDHSSGQTIWVTGNRSAKSTELHIRDNGVGIFKKIQRDLGLEDEKQAIFELSKGKLTTDPKRHSGQGIFFTSRMVNAFAILSGSVHFSHESGDEEDWVLDQPEPSKGTVVLLRVDNDTRHTMKKTYAQYSKPGTYGFNKTTIPVKLAEYATDQLVSRSQAKRVLLRVDQFSQVIVDFASVASVGQAFIDQIFRVFALEHPEVELFPLNATKEIRGLIRASIKAARPGFKG